MDSKVIWHSYHETGGISTHIAVSGPGRWLMKKLIAENIVKTLPEQTQQAIDLARQR